MRLEVTIKTYWLENEKDRTKFERCISSLIKDNAEFIQRYILSVVK